MRKRFACVFIVLFFIFLSSNPSFGAEIKKGIENFPDSYKPYLQELKNRHPNWEFSALYTDFNFDQVISNEYANDRNLVPINYSDTWKCTEPRKI